MNKLKKKTFWLIYLLLSFSIFLFLLAFGIVNYNETKKSITNNLEEILKREDNKKDNINTPDDRAGNVVYLDKFIYTILLNDQNEIVDIISNIDSSVSNETITLWAKEILDKSSKSNGIGNLYFSSRAYMLNNHKALVIMDLVNTKVSLYRMLLLEFSLFAIFSLVNYFLTKYLTDWLTKPVIESFEKQKRFISDASHELKTPLAIIISSSELLKTKPNETKWLTSICDAAGDMNKLIQRLLDMARSEQNTTYKKRVNDLSSTIKLATLGFEALAYEKGLTIKLEIDSDITYYYDEERIKELVGILIDNAISHAKSKSKITISLHEEKDNIILQVINTGDIIKKGEEEMIFERFYRGDEARGRGDNRYGLGLAIAKNIVLNHDGVIKAESINNKTIFTVTFMAKKRKCLKK